VKPLTEDRTTKHGVTWSRNDGYEFDEDENDLHVPFWSASATCNQGFVGDAVINQCTGGHMSPYSFSGCNLDTDEDGIADDEEDCYTNPDMSGSDVCGCKIVGFDDATGSDNCPTQNKIGMGVSSPFYAVDYVQWDAKEGTEFNGLAGSYSSMRMDPMFWTQEGTYFATDKSYAWSSSEGPGTLTSMSFVLSKSTLAFEAGYGGDLSNIKLMTKADDGTFTRMRRQSKLNGLVIRQIFWDVSGLYNEHVKIVIENDNSDQTNNRMYVNNIRMFDSVPGCLSSCITIQPKAANNLDIMGTTYEPASQGTSFTNDNEVLYCAVPDPVCVDTREESWCNTHSGPTNCDPGSNSHFAITECAAKCLSKYPQRDYGCTGNAKDTTDMHSVGATPGALFASNFPEGFAYDNLAMERLPSCIMVRKIPGDISTYQISMEAGQRRFAFTQDGNVGSLHCVYQTEKPQCIAFSGALVGSRQGDMHCVEGPPASTCADAVISLKCPMAKDAVCGVEKVQQDLLHCCDESGNGGFKNCLGHTRRLGESIRFSDSEVVDASAAENCVRACYQYPNSVERACMGWRLNAFNNKCTLALKCYPKSYMEVKSLELTNYEWNLIDGANPFDGLLVTVLQQIVS